MKFSLILEENGNKVSIPVDVSLKENKTSLKFKNKEHLKFLKKKMFDKKNKKPDSEIENKSSLKEDILKNAETLQEASCKSKKMLSKKTDLKCKYCGRIFGIENKDKYNEHLKKCFDTKGSSY